jgi:4-hydroxy-tetrahydrodipicolinate reductase
VGVNLLFALTQRAAAVLGSDYDCEVVEMHHRFKKDAPSGTAARLLEIILQERKLNDSALRHGREGIVGERTSSEVGIHALRGGDVVGDHTVMFAALGERLELTHKASDRSIFARGAIRAAEWVSARPNGLHDMQDVLGLRSS